MVPQLLGQHRGKGRLVTYVTLYGGKRVTSEFRQKIVDSFVHRWSLYKHHPKETAGAARFWRKEIEYTFGTTEGRRLITAIQALYRWSEGDIDYSLEPVWSECVHTDPDEPIRDGYPMLVDGVRVGIVNERAHQYPDYDHLRFVAHK